MLNPPNQSGAHFPIPRLSEGFLDDVVDQLGGTRTLASWNPPEGIQNADYIFPSAIVELKILEEEALHKESALRSIMEKTGEKLGDIWLGGGIGGVPGGDV